MKKLILLEKEESYDGVTTYKEAKDLARFDLEQYESERKKDIGGAKNITDIEFELNKIIKIADINYVEDYIKDVKELRGVDKKIIKEHIEQNLNNFEKTEEAYILFGKVVGAKSAQAVSKIMMDMYLNQDAKSVGEIIITIEEQKEINKVKNIIIVKNSIALKKNEIDAVLDGSKTITARTNMMRMTPRIQDGKIKRYEEKIMISAKDIRASK